MRKSLLYLCPFLLACISLQAQLEADPTLAAYYSQQFDSSIVKSHLSVLASDSLEGRETGTPGLTKAANYLSKQMRSWNLKAVDPANSYYQEIRLQKIGWEEVGLNVGKDSFRHMYDFVGFPDWNQNNPLIKLDQVIYVGYGIDDPAYSDYKRVNVKGKAIMISAGEPYSSDSLSIITNSKEPSAWSGDWERKLHVAQKHGATVVFMIDPQIQQTISNNRNRILNNKRLTAVSPKPSYPNNCFISTTIAKAIIGNKWKVFQKNNYRIRNSGIGRPIRLNQHIDLKLHLLSQPEYSKNILAVVEGSDPDLKDEWVVVSAHYDHLGKRGNSVFNGADDNGSGTSTAMEIIRLFDKARDEGYGPRRSVAILLFAGEEKGLIGSKYYTDNPLYPLDKTVVDLNVDMIGRVDEKHEANPQYIYVIGSDRLSTDLHKINEECNSIFTQLQLDYTFNERDDPNRFYYRSDHYHFAKNGIPIIFYFSGVHEDYHRPTDTIDKIMFDKMTKVGKLIFHTAWEIANRDERLKVNVRDNTNYSR